VLVSYNRSILHVLGALRGLIPTMIKNTAEDAEDAED
jgi:hypothetical protein